MTARDPQIATFAAAMGWPYERAAAELATAATYADSAGDPLPDDSAAYTGPQRHEGPALDDVAWLALVIACERAMYLDNITIAESVVARLYADRWHVAGLGLLTLDDAVDALRSRDPGAT